MLASIIFQAFSGYLLQVIIVSSSFVHALPVSSANGATVLKSTIPFNATDCVRGSCFPDAGDLLVGRSHRFTVNYFCSGGSSSSVKCPASGGPFWKDVRDSNKGKSNAPRSSATLRHLVPPPPPPPPLLMPPQQTARTIESTDKTSDEHRSFDLHGTAHPAAAAADETTAQSTGHVNSEAVSKMHEMSDANEAATTSPQEEEEEEVNIWYSPKAVDKVSLKLDLETVFQLFNIKVVLAESQVEAVDVTIERSSDSGATWSVYQYFAKNCTKFLTNGTAAWSTRSSLIEATCEQFSGVNYYYSFNVTPGDMTFDGTLALSPMQLEYSKVTNLRVNLSRSTGDSSHTDPLDTSFLAIKSILINGTCFCNGHSSKCIPAQVDQTLVQGMIYGRCQCSHYTTGANCQECLALYNDRQWRPAIAGEKNECKCKYLKPYDKNSHMMYSLVHSNTNTQLTHTLARSHT